MSDGESEDKILLTVPEAAAEANLTTAAIRNAIYRGKLPAKQIYGRLVIERAAFEQYRQTTKMGRPPKSSESAGS